MDPRHDRALLRRETGGIDLLSTTVSVLVIAAFLAAAALAVFVVIPWAQDNAAKQSLEQVVSAQSVHYALTTEAGDPRYGTVHEMVAADLISGVQDGAHATERGFEKSFSADNKLAIHTTNATRDTPTLKDTFTAWVRSDTGRVYTATETHPAPVPGTWTVRTEPGNLFADPFFMGADPYHHWAQAYAGGLEKTGTGTQHGSYFRSLDIDVTPGETLTFTATRTHLAGPNTGNSNIHVRHVTEAGTITGAENYLGPALMIPRAGTFTKTYTVPAGTTRLSIGIFSEENMSDQTRFRISDVRITR